MTDAWTLVPRRRVILDNDWAGDPDGLVALAHHVLSPTDDVRLVTSSSIPPIFPGSEDGAARGAAFAAELLSLLGADVPIVPGPESAAPGAPDPGAAAAVVAEAEREDDLPLVLVCAGPLTNVAAALRRSPAIARRLRLVWVGGSDGGFEYNRDTDRDAHDTVFAAAELAIDRIPLEAYRLVRASVTELRSRLEQSGPVGRWLWRRFAELPIPPGFPLGETWALGDSLPLLATALENDAVAWEPAEGTRRRLVDPDARLLVEDFFAKLRGR